jgi:hypothetical protein
MDEKELESWDIKTPWCPVHGILDEEDKKKIFYSELENAPLCGIREGERQVCACEIWDINHVI